MSIKVNALSKFYGTQKAVNAISFEANAGKILGFLGPNGAGKSTTMKMLTCFLPASAGEASVCDFDIASQSLEVRKNIGLSPRKQSAIS